MFIIWDYNNILDKLPIIYVKHALKLCAFIKYYINKIFYISLQYIYLYIIINTFLGSGNRCRISGFWKLAYLGDHRRNLYKYQHLIGPGIHNREIQIWVIKSLLHWLKYSVTMELYNIRHSLCCMNYSVPFLE